MVRPTAFPDPLISVDWLASHLNAPDVRVVDATWFAPWTNPGQTSQQHYDSCHIPGAVYFDIDEIADRNSPYPHMLPPAELFSSRVRKMGLGDGNRIIVYDANGYFASARVWWMFRAMGHTDVAVLDGGFAAWKRAGQPIEDLPPTTPMERHFTVRMRADLVRTKDQVQKNIGKEDIRTLFDARPPGRFAGTDPEPRPELRQGHIPGSINLPHGGVLNDDGTMKSAEDLRSLFGEHLERSLLTCTCGSGVSAAVIALALGRAGRDDAALYDGSWSEWGALADTPVAEGSG